MIDVSVIIPAYNEAATIGDLITQLKTVPGLQSILVIDDGSTDGTARASQDAGARVLSHAIQRGNGAAVKTGLQEASSEWVIIMDGDGQHHIDDVRRLIAEPPQLLLVIGSRSFRWFRFRDIGNIFMGRFASLLSGRPIRDLTSGLRRLHRKTALTFWHLYPEGYSFPTTSTMLFASSGYPVGSIDIVNRPRPAHASASKLQPFRDGLRFLTIIYRIAMLGYPLRFFAPVGIGLILFGVLWTIRTMLRTSQVSAGGALLVLSGLTLLLFGTIADQLTQIRKMISTK
jgi:glycosyltransferase involved in cell wall biosynthesis